MIMPFLDFLLPSYQSNISNVKKPAIPAGCRCRLNRRLILNLLNHYFYIKRPVTRRFIQIYFEAVKSIYFL
jgi:hypothetical protein